MTPDELKKLKDLCDKATPGVHHCGHWGEYNFEIRVPRSDLECLFAEFNFEADALFYAAAREALPKLISEVSRLRKNASFDLSSWLERSEIRRNTPFIEQKLPEYPVPNVVIPLGKLKEFNEHYSAIAAFAAEMCDTTVDKLCLAHMVFSLSKVKHLEAQLAEANKRLEGAVEALKFYASHTGRQHDCPTCDQGFEARALLEKWGLVEKKRCKSNEK